MRVLLVQPRQGRGVGFKVIAVTEPLGLEMVGASLEGHEVRLVDLLNGMGELDRALDEFEPEAVGVSCSFTVDVYQALEIAARAKASRKKPFVFVGGHHASLSPADFNCRLVDAVVVGEGETTARELIATLQAGERPQAVAGLILNQDGTQVATPSRGLIQNLDSLPFAGRSLARRYRTSYYLGFNKPTESIETARGCPYRCNFCSVWNFYQGRCRTKSPERVVAEIEATSSPYLLFTDDNFLLDVERAAEIGRLLEKKKLKKEYCIQARSDAIVRHPEVILSWKKLGLRGIFIGVEKIDEQGLKEVNKHNTVENNEAALEFCRRQGIGVTASFIVDPSFTPADFARLIEYVKRWKVKTPSFTVLTPLPGTALFSQLRDKLITNNYELFDLLHVVLPTKLDLPDFYREFANLYASCYNASALRWMGLFDLVKALLSGRISLEHIRRLTSMAAVFGDANQYLSDHRARREGVRYVAS